MKIILDSLFLYFVFVIQVIAALQHCNNTEINCRGSCILPPHPEKGKWVVFDSPYAYNPGETVNSSTILNVWCDKGYKGIGATFIYCNNGIWSADMPKCIVVYPAVKSTNTTKVICRRSGTEVDCNEPTTGTIATYTCAPFYEDLQLRRNPNRYCHYGKWDNEKPNCSPVCGVKSVSAQTLIIGGNTATKGDYPWQVAIYFDKKTYKELICGGSLLSQKVILTAAHCITDTTGAKRNKELYMVAVGKYYRNYSDPRDTETQFSTLKETFIPEQYGGDSQNYVSDIAILVTEKTFKLSKRVQPVCMDWGGIYENYLFEPNSKGIVTGWGYTKQTGQPSEVLKEVSVPYIDYNQCSQEIPTDYKIYLTYDKLCSGYINRSIGVCQGDSGGALVFKNNFDDRYYAAGIVSVSPLTDGSCDIQQYALYTKVSKYITSFIIGIERSHRPDNLDIDMELTTDGLQQCNSTDPNCRKETCILPPHPEKGKWVVWGSPHHYSPRETVISSTILTVECDKRYKAVGSTIILCNNGVWNANMPRCIVLCPPVTSTNTANVICERNGAEVDCNEPISGTIATYTCVPFYEDAQLRKIPNRYCIDGSWDYANPNCRPVCGVKSVAAQPLIIGGNTVAKSSYPWQVAIYLNKKTGKELICGGSLLNPRTILTAAQCVTNTEGVKRNKGLYIVAAGKYYRNFNDERDSEAQFSTLKEIFIPEQYRGLTGNFAGDIAILVTEKTFIISKRVLPICVDWSGIYENYLLEPNPKGIVTGWGFTKQTDEPSEVLKEISVPYVNYNECYQELPSNFKIYLTNDKLCAGYLNQSIGVCKGDSGGALVFKNKDDDRYYVAGIVSIGPIAGDGYCDIQQYALYTDVSKYVSFISRIERSNRP